MVKAKVNGSNGAVAQNSSVILDEIMQGKNGSVRFLVDLATINDYAEQYHSQLLMSRQIPFDRQNIIPMDGLFVYISQNCPWIPSNGVVPAVRAHYNKLAEEAYRDAMVLAVLADHNNVFTEPPAPYEVEAEKPLPGLVKLPGANKNLSNPLERRLKQIYDFISSDIELVGRFYRVFENALVEVTRRNMTETDEVGFQSK